MALSGLTRRLRGPSRRSREQHDALIGDAADRTFPCPGCARPLAHGQGRCPGCGRHLVAGVLFRSALFFILVGIVVGMMGGAVIAGIAMGSRLATADSGPPVAAAPTAAPVPSIVAAALPAGVAGGLLQVASINDRLAQSAAALKALLARRSSGAVEIAPILRKVSADVQAGDQATRRLAPWGPAGVLVAKATTLYGALALVAAEGLNAPFADDAAYVASGKRMLSALGPLPAVDAVTHAVAGEAGLTLPGATPAP
jgi:hypothetical protein